MRNTAFIFIVILADIWGSLAQTTTDLLCEKVTCAEGESCTALRKCNAAGCSVEAVCLSQGEWSFGCPWGAGLVEPYTGRNVEKNHPLIPPGTPLNVEVRPPPLYQLASCWTSSPCPDGFFCSTRLMDTFARCCPSRAGAGPKPGNCPAITSVSDSVYTCVDQCLTDADCSWDEKCCVTSEECPRKACKPPA